MIIGWIIITACIIGIAYHLNELYQERIRYFYIVKNSNGDGNTIEPYILIYDYKESYFLDKISFMDYKGNLNTKYVLNNDILKNMLTTGRWKSNRDIFEILLKEYING